MGNFKHIDIEQFSKQGFKFETKDEIVTALKTICDWLIETPDPGLVSSLWFVNAVKSWDGRYIEDLLRSIGLVKTNINGVTAMARRMKDLIESGSTKAAAARICASEFGHDTKFVLRCFEQKSSSFSLDT